MRNDVHLLTVCQQPYTRLVVRKGKKERTTKVNSEQEMEIGGAELSHCQIVSLTDIYFQIVKKKENI